MSYKKGDTIHCENGHLICTLGRDLKLGESSWASAMVDWQQTEPEIGILEHGLFCDICRGVISFHPKKQEEIAEKLIRESLIKLLEEDLKDQGE